MDPQLVKRAQNGDELAFEALVVATHPVLFRVAFGILREADSAEDATQRALLEAWRSLSRLRDRSGFVPWSLGHLIEICRTEAEKAELDESDEVHPAADELGAADPFGSILDRDQLSRGFRQLSFDDRTVLVLRYLADLTPEQAGVVLGVGSAKVATRSEAVLEALGAAIDSDPVSSAEMVPQPEGA